MAGRAEAGEGTTASLLSDVVTGLGRLLQGELRLARAEAAAGLKTAGAGLVKLALALVAGLVGLNTLAGAAVAGLVAAGLGPAVAAVAVGLGLCALALGLATGGASA